MTSRERVEAAFNKQETDKVPIHHLGFSSEIASVLLGREAFVGGGIQRWREAVAWWQGEEAHAEYIERSRQDALDIARFCEHDIIRCSYWRYNRKPTRRIDENTFMYEDGPEEDWKILRYDPGSEQSVVVDYIRKQAASLEDLEREVAAMERTVEDFAPSADGLSAELAAQEMLGDEYVLKVGGGSVGFPHSAVWLEAVALRPELVGRYMDVGVERNRRIIPFLAELGFRFQFVGNDFAGNDGPMYSPQLFHEITLPRLVQTTQIAHDCGVYVLFASDGNLWPVADDLFGASGLDGYYEIDGRAGMDLGKLRERFPELTLIGNISSHTVHLGSREEIIDEALSALEEAKRSYGIIVGTSNYFVPGTPVENVEVLLETIKENR